MSGRWRSLDCPGGTWGYEWQIGLVILASVLTPLVWRWCSRQGASRWQPWLWGCAMLWGLAWVLMAYSLAPIEFSVGFSLAFNMVSLLLLTALIAFYCEWRVFYSLSAPPLIFLLFEEHWVMVPPSPCTGWRSGAC